MLSACLWFFWPWQINYTLDIIMNCKLFKELIWHQKEKLSHSKLHNTNHRAFWEIFPFVILNCAHPLSEHFLHQGESDCISSIFASRGEAAGLFELSKSVSLSVYNNFSALLKPQKNLYFSNKSNEVNLLYVAHTQFPSRRCQAQKVRDTTSSNKTNYVVQLNKILNPEEC